MSISANFPNVKPSLLLDFANAQQLPPAVTFTRATTAAYYNGSTTAMAEQNLIADSQVLNDAAWLLTNNSVVTANTTTAPDGTLTADTFSATGSSTTTGTPTQVYKMVDGVAGLTYTASIYAKANTSNFVYCREYFSHNTEDVTWFNLSTGALGTTSANHTASIVSVGSGWYRCVITTTVDTTRNQSLGFGVSTANSNYNITTSSSIYLWGAQLEQRNAVTAYTATTTQAITNYVPQLLTAGGGQPRFDHNPTTSESLGLLIEEQRTNLITNSGNLSGGTWSLSDATVTGNTIVAPDGTLTGGKIILNAGSTGYIGQSIGVSAGSTVYTVYFKAGEYRRVSLWEGAVSAVNVTFDLISGTIVGQNSATALMTSVGNGWYRCSMISTQTAGSRFWLISPVGDTATTPFTPATTGNGFNGVYAWGAQLEQAAFPSAYIATTSAAATRAADAAVMTGSNFTSWFNNSEGTLYVEASPQTQSTNSFGMASLTNLGGSTNSIAMYYTGGNVVDVEALVNSVAQYTFLIARGSQPTKVAHGYKVNDANVALNGTASTTDTVCLVPPVNMLTIGTIYDATSYHCNGTVRKIAYYPIRVTNAQLAALTA